jgi:glycerophosphoryl diester phosphodiesterase
MDQLAQMDARAAFPDWPEPCRIPTLAQVLAQLPTDVRLEIEIKGDETTRLETLAPKLVELIERHDAAGRVTLSSFDANALRILQRVAPGLPRAYIGAYDSPQFLRTALELECVQADIPLTTGSRDQVRAAHAEGLRVTGWPGNTIEQLQTLVDWAVEGLPPIFPALPCPSCAKQTCWTNNTDPHPAVPG